MTRMNNIPALEDRGQGVPGLIPFWDLCNHANGRVSEQRSAPACLQVEAAVARCLRTTCRRKAGSVCYASRDFEAGEQFFIFYGVRPNAEFLLHNGFVYRDNEHDAVAVRLGVSRGDALHQRRCRLLERLGVPASGVFYLHREGAPIDASLLAFLRVFNMDADALDQWLLADNVSELGSDECPGLPDGLETTAWRFLHTRLGLLLRLYPGPAADDRRLLAEPGALTPRARLAVTLRLGEKEILERALLYADQRMA
ncbi:actin-histidine N-methyltransferase-like [Pollicipes pollicipes]|uniref:actin-histidine N-methyltransferase-like n=1 Tax=Pollicipes pollicipes TaxID=41117 RepID=UPI0018858C52|nr:actin-histidine N-methyltransferase-like [Pollicipes pollicipes]